MSGVSVVMIGATGAVGTEVVKQLLQMDVERLTLFGRRRVEDIDPPASVEQHVVYVLGEAPYEGLLGEHDVAICTLGVGEPSKVPKEQFVAIDKDAVLTFARACRDAGVRHFQLLSSVGADASSRSFYLRTKGELEDGLRALGFPRLSLFHPSMILTPTNRYGFTQAVVLKVWPLLSKAMVGSLQKYRGVGVERLGAAMAHNSVTSGQGEEVLEWQQFEALNAHAG